MYKLIFTICIFLGVSSCTTEGTEIEITATNTTEEITIKPSARINIRNTASYFHRFTYDGHEYLTNTNCDILYHLLSCPCHNKTSSILDNHSLFKSDNLFDN